MATRMLRRTGVRAVALAAVLLAAQGCTYLGNRGRDAAQMFDVGLTFTKTPQFGIYANCPLVTPVGYSKVDGTYVGLGGGKLGAMEHHQNNKGFLLWGREENSWDGGLTDELKTETKTDAGVVGIAQGVAEGGKTYKPACIHYLHLGWVGATGNIHYYEIMDFAAGWAGLDPSGDDRGGFQSTMLASADAGPERDEPSGSPPPRPKPRRAGKAAEHRFPIELLVP